VCEREAVGSIWHCLSTNILETGRELELGCTVNIPRCGRIGGFAELLGCDNAETRWGCLRERGQM
jgi:hypothetical protein